MLVFTLFSLFGLAIGFFLVTRPALAIELQKKFYAGINWKIEPISMEKEIRNTRLMGLFLAAACIATLVFSLPIPP